MVIVRLDKLFRKKFDKIKDNILATQIKKQIKKIIENPRIGKPMRYGRKGTREVYTKPFRLSYVFLLYENKITFIDLYHKKKQ